MKIKIVGILATVVALWTLRTIGWAQSDVLPVKTSSNGAAGTNGNKLPSAGDVEGSLKRELGDESSVSWQILEIRPSSIPGVAEVLVSINKNAPTHIFVPPDGRNAIIGELIPFGADPFAPARNRLQAADGPVRGAQHPAIRIVEFSDLECPHCKVAQPILEKVVGDFPQVQYVFQQFPLAASLHPWAMKAAQYSD